VDRARVDAEGPACDVGALCARRVGVQGGEG
jgi:hypothetical protein